MKQTIVIYTCDICGKQMNEYDFSEKIRHTNITEHYCTECYVDNAKRCNVCGDRFVHLKEHQID